MEKPPVDEQGNVEGTTNSSSTINTTRRPRNPIEELEMLGYLSDTEEEEEASTTAEYVEGEEDFDDDEEVNEEDDGDEAEDMNNDEAEDINNDEAEDMNNDEANDGFVLARVHRKIVEPTFEPKVSDKSIQATLYDPDVLDCYICSEPLTIPVFQCINGHIACSKCCSKLVHKCPFCTMPIDCNRCLAIEKLLVSLQIACQNATYGCNEIIRYNKKYTHEKTCIYQPCSCPQLGCNFVAMSSNLYLHFKENHMNEEISFEYDESFSVLLSHEVDTIVLQAQTDDKLFVLKNKVFENLGNAVTISHIGPNSLYPVSHYEIKTKSEVENKFLHYRSSAKNIQGRTFVISSKTRFLLIPLEFFNSNGQLVLEIRISLSHLKLKPVHLC